MIGHVWDKQIVVGLTGGIGSGKSMVAALFEMHGWAVFNSDEAAKSCYDLAEVKRRVSEWLGPKAYENGRIHRKYLAEQIFRDASLREKINDLIHPLVRKKFEDFVRKMFPKPVIKESALLFESEAYKDCMKIILVISPMPLRLERIRKRDGLSDEEIMSRIQAQKSDEEKIIHADFIIYNDEQHSLIEQVMELHQRF